MSREFLVRKLRDKEKGRRLKLRTPSSVYLAGRIWRVIYGSLGQMFAVSINLVLVPMAKPDELVREGNYPELP